MSIPKGMTKKPLGKEGISSDLPPTIQNIPRFSTPFCIPWDLIPVIVGLQFPPSSQPHLSPSSEDCFQMRTTCMIIQHLF